MVGAGAAETQALVDLGVCYLFCDCLAGHWGCDCLVA